PTGHAVHVHCRAKLAEWPIVEASSTTCCVLNLLYPSHTVPVTQGLVPVRIVRGHRRSAYASRGVVGAAAQAIDKLGLASVRCFQDANSASLIIDIRCRGSRIVA